MLYLTESDVEKVLPMADAMEAVEVALRALGQGQASNRPRQRIIGPGVVMHLMPAGWPGRGYVGFKNYTSAPGGTRFWLHLFDSTSGDWLAVIEADRLGQLRTGAASGVATRYLARPEARTLGLIGSGWQAESQLEAVCTARTVVEVKVYSRSPERAQAFAARMGERVRVPVRAVPTAAQAVRQSDIVVTATSAREPVLSGDWLAPGAHVNAVGSNWANRRELDESAVTRAASIWVDSLEQARIESGDLLAPIAAGHLSWDRVGELADVVAGNAASRTRPDDITLFKSHGIALEDVAVGALVYERARRRGFGREIDLRP